MLAKNIWDLCHYQKSDAKKNTQKNVLDLGDYKKKLNSLWKFRYVKPNQMFNPKQKLGLLTLWKVTF